MVKILVCGLCPLPFENTLRSFGPGIRSWQFAYGLAEAGHEVELIAMKIPQAYEDGEGASEETREGVRIRRIDANRFMESTEIRERIADMGPDCVVGATVYGSYALARADPDVAFWADQFGHFTAEAQAKARLEGGNWPLGSFWHYLEPVLRAADRYSVVSHRQRYALVGELGLAGRLTAETCGYEFTSVIPCALVPDIERPTRPMLRGSAVPRDAFVLLWSGGYNVWSDVGTLFRGLEIAMEEDPRIHFVSTGGEIGGHDEKTYGDFEQRVGSSAFSERYHLQGWVEADLVASYQAEADLGVLTEVPIYEGLLGSKNRIVQWLGQGLPVAYNKVGDLGDLLAEEEIGLTFPIGDAEALADRILWAARHPDELAVLAERARAYARRELSFPATIRDLAEWAKDPVPAPDARLRRTISFIHDFPAAREAPREPKGAARVHAVVVHHRGREMLAECLESLLASRDVELRVVVVSNHCQEDLPEIASGSSRVHVVVSEVSLGFAKANNLGVSWAREHLGEPEFYYFVNNDTRSTPQAASLLVEAVRDCPGAAMAGPRLHIFGAPEHLNSLGLKVTEDAWSWDEGIGQRLREYGDLPQTRPVLSVTGSALLIDAPVFYLIGGWTEVYEYYFEDIDLGIKVWKVNRQVLHVPDAVVFHQISATMTEGSERKVFFFWRNRLVLAFVHWPRDLLFPLVKRAVFNEILDRRRTDRPLLRRALGATLRRLPALLVSRRRYRGSTGWREFLVPPGSVPVITLPEVETDPARLERRRQAVLKERPRMRPSMRERLARAERKAAVIEAQNHVLRRDLARIHGSKMWRIWMFSLAVRRFLLKPFSWLRSAPTS